MAERDPVAQFRQLFLSHQPSRQARMNWPGATAKYHTVHQPIRDRDIRAHLVGRLTLAAPLVGPAGLAWAAALDVDHGGTAALWQLLLRSRSVGCTAFALTSRAGRHAGGHVWLLFDAPAAPERLRLCAARCVENTGIQAELYPSRRTLRLPLGVHRGSGRRGALLLPDGRVLDLDGSPPAIGTAIALLAALPRNAISALPELPAPSRPHARRLPPLRCATGDRIAAFNCSTDLVALLESYGGRVAQALPHGGVLMRCPCPGHAHGDGQPSLELRPARSPRRGRFLAVGYAPSCLFSAEGGLLDAFGVLCRWHSWQPAEALERLHGPALPAEPAKNAHPSADVD